MCQRAECPTWSAWPPPSRVCALCGRPRVRAHCRAAGIDAYLAAGGSPDARSVDFVAGIPGASGARVAVVGGQTCLHVWAARTAASRLSDAEWAAALARFPSADVPDAMGRLPRFYRDRGPARTPAEGMARVKEEVAGAAARLRAARGFVDLRAPSAPGAAALLPAPVEVGASLLAAPAPAPAPASVLGPAGEASEGRLRVCCSVGPARVLLPPRARPFPNPWRLTGGAGCLCTLSIHPTSPRAVPLVCEQMW
jgi:hypothetical protein